MLSRAHCLTCVLLLLCLLPACPARHPVPRSSPSPEARVRIEGEVLDALEAGAADLDVVVRERALTLLTRFDPEEGAGAWGSRGLADPNPYVQRAVIRELSRRVSEAASRDLLRSFVLLPKADTYNRALAAMALFDAGDAGTREVLDRARREASQPWEQAPLSLALARAGDDEALAALREALENGVFPLETTFFEEIGASGLDALVPSLQRAAEVVEEDLALPVGAALLRLGSTEGRAMLQRALSSTDEETVMAALDLLRELPASLASPLVRSVEHRQDDAGLYARVLRLGWGEIPFEKARGAFVSPDRELRALAFGFLARESSRIPRDAVREVRRISVEALEDEDGPREEILRLLAVLGGSEELPHVRSLLTAPELSVRVEAAAALTSMRKRSP
jgi:hypothetical protein